MLKLTILLVLGLLFSSVHGNCNPKYTRVFFGTKYLLNPENPQTLIEIRFDTKKSCPESYAEVTIAGKTLTVPCPEKKLVFQNSQTTPFETYIHSCKVPNYVTHTGSLEYMVYGLRPSESILAADQSSYTVNLPKEDQFTSVVLGDWGYLKKQPYIPLGDSLQKVLDSKKEINALLIAGDIAYDLETENGLNYQEFMEMIGQVSPYWPLLMDRGNHEINTPENKRIFSAAFQIYDLDWEDHFELQAYSFSTLNLMLFDPYQKIYNLSDSFYQSQLKYMKEQFLSMPQKQSRMLITSSHYPLFCSYVKYKQEVGQGLKGSPYCQEYMVILQELFELFDQQEVDLYIGAHKHCYQRIKPYKSGNFKAEETTPFSRGRLVSLLEAVAGNDGGIQVEPPKKQSAFSDALIYGKTGYAIMEIKSINGNPTLTYQHYNADVTQAQDSFVISSTNSAKQYLLRTE